uniref:Uncharacterized protein n=1 Tax=Tanacetum cinerariifolium TaxID=118510 RepID=A0A699GP15_TANCI|nr:hypothetical protein [Tanacetum cinerariifolium]
MSSSMSLSTSSSMSSSMSSIPANTTGATKLRKKSIIKQTGGDVKAKALKLESEVSRLKNELGKRMDDKSLEGVVNGNEMGLDEIPGFAKGVFNGNELLTGYKVENFETKMEVQVDKKSESKVSGL